MSVSDEYLHIKPAKRPIPERFAAGLLDIDDGHITLPEALRGVLDKVCDLPRKIMTSPCCVPLEQRSQLEFPTRNTHRLLEWLTHDLEGTFIVPDHNTVALWVLADAWGSTYNRYKDPNLSWRRAEEWVDLHYADHVKFNGDASLATMWHGMRTRIDVGPCTDWPENRRSRDDDSSGTDESTLLSEPFGDYENNYDHELVERTETLKVREEEEQKGAVDIEEVAENPNEQADEEDYEEEETLQKVRKSDTE